MKSYLMTSEETGLWESDNAPVRETARKDIRAKAQQIANDSGETVEVYTDDSCLMDVLVPRR